MGDLDLPGMFEEAFRGEPPPPLIDPTVRAGRAALRRRRIATGGGAAACVLAVALLGTQLDGKPTAEPDPLHRPTPSSTISAEEKLTRAARVDESWREDCGRTGQKACDEYAAGKAPVGMAADGTVLRTGADVVIIKKAVDPSPPAGTTRIEVEARTPDKIAVCWWVITRHADGSVTVQAADPAMSLIDFITWANAVNRDRQVDGAPSLIPARVLLG